MSYFVVDPTTGEKFGPAEMDLLNQWAAEGRIVATTVLEDMVTGSRTPASQLYGLMLPMAAGAPPPSPTASEPSPYPRSYAQAPGIPVSAGQQDANQAWIWFVVGFLCCSVIGYPMSIVCANRAIALGNDGARVAKILSIIFLVINVIVGGLMVIGALSGN